MLEAKASDGVGGKLFDCLDSLVNCSDALRYLLNGLLGIGHCDVPNFRRRCVAAERFWCGHAHHPSSLIVGCFIGHAWKVALFAATFNPESRRLIFELTDYQAARTGLLSTRDSTVAV